MEEDAAYFELSFSFLKVPYYEKHVFSGLYIYKVVHPEPTNSQNEESKQVSAAHPLVKWGSNRLSLSNERRAFHRLASSAR